MVSLPHLTHARLVHAHRQTQHNGLVDLPDAQGIKIKRLLDFDTWKDDAWKESNIGYVHKSHEDNSPRRKGFLHKHSDDSADRSVHHHHGGDDVYYDDSLHHHHGYRSDESVDDWYGWKLKDDSETDAYRQRRDDADADRNFADRHTDHYDDRDGSFDDRFHSTQDDLKTIGDDLDDYIRRDEHIRYNDGRARADAGDDRGMDDPGADDFHMLMRNVHDILSMREKVADENRLAAEIALLRYYDSEEAMVEAQDAVLEATGKKTLKKVTAKTKQATKTKETTENVPQAPTPVEAPFIDLTAAAVMENGAADPVEPVEIEQKSKISQHIATFAVFFLSFMFWIMLQKGVFWTLLDAYSHGHLRW